MFSVIFIVTILICFVIIGLTIGRKFPLLANINLNELSAEKQAEVKVALLEKRLKRKFDFIPRIFQAKIWQIILWGLKGFFQYLMELEKRYKAERQTKKIAQLTQLGKKEKIKEKLKLAEELAKAENWSEAEKVYIELIALEPKNIPAYLGLAKVYFKQKDFEHSREVYEHILKISQKNDWAFSGLGDLAVELGNWQSAKDHYQKSIELAQQNPEHYLNLALVEYKLNHPGRALTAIRRASELEANNPKYLDFLIEAALLNKNKILALDTFNKLKIINPENQKLAEFRQRIQEM